MKITKYVKSWMLALILGMIYGVSNIKGGWFLLKVFITLVFITFIIYFYETELKDAKEMKEDKHGR